MNKKGITLGKLLLSLMIIAAIVLVVTPWIKNLYAAQLANEMLKTTKTYYESMHRFVTEKSYIPSRFADLDVIMPDSVPANKVILDAKDAVKIKNFYYYFFPNRKAIFASYGETDNPNFYGLYIENDSIYCYGKKGLPSTYKMCEGVLGGKIYASTQVTDYYIISKQK